MVKLFNNKNILNLTPKELVNSEKIICLWFFKVYLFPHKTVLQNVGYGLAIQNISKDVWSEKAHKWIKSELDGLKHTTVNFQEVCNKG